MTFLTPSDLIKRIREIVPGFADRVAGAAQYDAIEDIAKISLPACFVMLTDNAAETISNQTSLKQDVAHGFDVVVILDGVDKRKQEAEEAVVAFKEMLLYALNGWLPEDADEDAAPLEFNGDIYRDANAARYVRVFRFSQDYAWASDTDGHHADDLPNFDKFFADITFGTEGVLPVQITDLYQP